MPPFPELAGVEHRYHDLATGVRAHVAHAGADTAPPLVLLHGFPQHWYCWRHVIAALQGEYRILDDGQHAVIALAHGPAAQHAALAAGNAMAACLPLFAALAAAVPTELSYALGPQLALDLSVLPLEG